MFCGCEAMRWSWESSRFPLWRTLPVWTSSSIRVRRWADIPLTSCRREPGPPIWLVNSAVQKCLKSPGKLALRKSSMTLTSCWRTTDCEKSWPWPWILLLVCYNNSNTRHRTMESHCCLKTSNCNYLFHSSQRLKNINRSTIKLWWKKNVTWREDTTVKNTTKTKKHLCTRILSDREWRLSITCCLGCRLGSGDTRRQVTCLNTAIDRGTRPSALEPRAAWMHMKQISEDLLWLTM